MSTKLLKIYLYPIISNGRHKSTNLASDFDGLEEVGLASRVNNFLGGVVPVKVHDGLLEAQQVVDGAVNDIDGGGVARLGTQVVLPV